MAPRASTARTKAPAPRSAGRARKKAPAVRVVDLDGIPCFVEDRGGPLYLGMTFRVGYADETLPTHGLTHLVEHLSLFEASASRLPINGSVTATETNLVVRGDHDETRSFAEHVRSALPALPLHRLEAEARVLRTEGASRSTSPLASLTAYRFGAQGHGLAWLPELAFVDPDPAQVQAWADRWFTAGNVALWATGTPPGGLRLDLPPGAAAPAPAATPLPWSLPGWFADPAGSIGISFVADRTDALLLATQLLERRAHARLRLDEGHSYSVRVFVDLLTTAQNVGVIAADALSDHVGSVRDGLLGELGRLATAPPTADELEAVIRDQARVWSDPDAAPMIAANHASNHVQGRRVRAHVEAEQDLRAVSPDEVCRAAQEILESAIVQLPYDTGMPDRRFTHIPAGSPATVVGTSHLRTTVLDETSAGHALVVGSVGASLAFSDTERVTVLTKDLVAVQHWTDGARTWWGRDGLRLFVHPDEWKGGPGIVASLDAMAPADLVVRMPQAAGSSYLEEVGRRGAASPAKRKLFGKRKR